MKSNNDVFTYPPPLFFLHIHMDGWMHVEGGCKCRFLGLLPTIKTSDKNIFVNCG
jgi:hypothetical protein